MRVRLEAPEKPRLLYKFGLVAQSIERVGKRAS